MSLTLLSNTNNNEFSGNSIHARFETSNYINTAGVKSKWTVVFSAAPSLGNSFGFTSNRLSINFVFLSGTGTGIQRNLAVPIGTWNNAMMQTVANAMNAFADFALYYIATAVGTNIAIEAKEAGDQYSMYSRGVSGVTNGTYIAGVTEILEPNYKIVLIVRNLDTDKVIGTLSVNQIDGYAEVDLKDLLYTQRKFDFVHTTPHIYYRIEEVRIPYKLSFTDSFGSPPVQRVLQETGTRYCVAAKMDYNKFNTISGIETTFSNYYSAEGVLQGILSSATRVNRRIDLTKFDYLDYYNLGYEMKVRITARYANNTTAVIDIVHIGANNNAIYRYCIHFGLLSSLNNQDDIIGFDVVFLDNSSNTEFSGIVNYEVDRDNYPDKRNFVFQNKWWGVDTLLCTGVVGDNANYIKDVVAGTAQYPKDKRFYTRINKVEKLRTHTQNTGWLNKDEVALFEEMLASENVWVWDAELEGYKKIVINTDKVQLKESQRGMNAYEFEYMEEASF